MSVGSRPEANPILRIVPRTRHGRSTIPLSVVDRRALGRTGYIIVPVRGQFATAHIESEQSETSSDPIHRAKAEGPAGIRADGLIHVETHHPVITHARPR